MLLFLMHHQISAKLILFSSDFVTCFVKPKLVQRFLDSWSEALAALISCLHVFLSGGDKLDENRMRTGNLQRHVYCPVL
jgi:hypothetical protein